MRLVSAVRALLRRGRVERGAMAVLFALDRGGAVAELTDLLERHDIVLLDRYVASNAAYGAARLRQGPDGGFVMHWSRLVDAPIAGLILFFRLFTSNFWAERLACGIAPLLPLSIAMTGLMLVHAVRALQFEDIVRQLVGSIGKRLEAIRALHRDLAQHVDAAAQDRLPPDELLSVLSASVSSYATDADSTRDPVSQQSINTGSVELF